MQDCEVGITISGHDFPKFDSYQGIKAIFPSKIAGDCCFILAKYKNLYRELIYYSFRFGYGHVLDGVR